MVIVTVLKWALRVTWLTGDIYADQARMSSRAKTFAPHDLSIRAYPPVPWREILVK